MQLNLCRDCELDLEVKSDSDLVFKVYLNLKTKSSHDTKQITPDTVVILKMFFVTITSEQKVTGKFSKVTTSED